MGKFGSAKVFDAEDKRLQTAHNYLTDLLDTGYIVETTIKGEKIRIEINPKVGFAFYQNSQYRGGLEFVAGFISLITDILKSANNSSSYIQFETELDGGINYGVTNFYVTKTGLNAGDAINHLEIKGAADDISLYTSISSKGDTNTAIELLADQETPADTQPASIVIVSNPIGTDPYIQMQAVDTSSNSVLVTLTPHALNISSLSAYANNAAAIAGGLEEGDLYRTGGDPDSVCIVH